MSDSICAICGVLLFDDEFEVCDPCAEDDND